MLDDIFQVETQTSSLALMTRKLNSYRKSPNVGM